MANPDILLEQDRISVVGGNGPEETNGTERGDLEITTAEGDPASIRLNADRANLTLGGGSGNAPEGDLRLRDENENLRIQVTAETGNRNAPNEDRVWIDGGKGQITVGDGQNDFVHLDGENAEVEVRDVTGDAQARLNNTGLMLSQFTGEGPVLAPVIDPETRDTIRLFGDQARAAIGNNFVSGTVNLYRSGSTDTSDGFFHETVTIDAEDAQATFGGSDRNGQVTLTDRNDNERVQIDGGGGELLLFDATQQTSVPSPEILLLSKFATGEALAAVGGASRSGELWLRKPEQNSNQAPVVMDLKAENNAGNPQAIIGGEGTDGVITAKDGNDTTTAEIQAAKGNLVAGGDDTEGTVLIRHTDGSGNSVNYRLKATQQGLVFSTMKAQSGGNPSVSSQQALRIDPDGTVRVKGGSVQSL
ncbi:MAG: hypothetical protein V5A30_02950 [Haloarculaceae archaeon]